MRIMVTGHRPNKLGGYKPNPTQTWVKNELETVLTKALKKHPKLETITGMALGVDQWWAEISMKLQVPFHAFIPFRGQESNWSQESQDAYRQLLKHAASQVYVSPGSYSAYKMQVRNQAMVNNANICVAVWDGTKGGTYNCIQYAISKHKHIYMINPTTMVVG